MLRIKKLNNPKIDASLYEGGGYESCAMDGLIPKKGTSKLGPDRISTHSNGQGLGGKDGGGRSDTVDFSLEDLTIEREHQFESKPLVNEDKQVSEDEIKKALFDMAPLKASGSDGFHALFFQSQ
ncbi:hypothetical protein J1N35_004732 [Gossypium stocksii]|uniref:Uncharacterized protein n=1 Tax=Gossypium stocksii TaxID=47602 RepID=A0A9D3WCJ4_9ROSI|nr:hypothetical protein J1N35_004732 [Gossypium stocksii]